MNIGDKIKFLRNKRDLSQSQLADKSGVHLLSIKKYENNQMMPSSQQLIKLADALNINSYALTENSNNIRFKTVGDLYGILIMLNKIGLITLSAYNTQTVMIEINNVFAPFLDLRNQTNIINWETFNAIATEKLQQHSSYPIFIQWVSNKENLVITKKSLANWNNSDALKTIEDQIEILELELQLSNDKL